MSGAAQGAPGVGPPVAPRSRGAVMTLLSRLVREKPLGAVGGVIVLAFLFVGAFAPLLVSVEGKKYMLKNPWLSLWPGLSLAVVVYGVNMLGDALRDLLDPRLRGGIGRIGAAK